MNPLSATEAAASAVTYAAGPKSASVLAKMGAGALGGYRVGRHHGNARIDGATALKIWNNKKVPVEVASAVARICGEAEALTKMSKDKRVSVAHALAQNPETPLHLLPHLLSRAGITSDRDPAAATAVARFQTLPLTRELVKQARQVEWLAGTVAGRSDLTGEHALLLLGNGFHAARSLVGRDDLPELGPAVARALLQSRWVHTNLAEHPRLLELPEDVLEGLIQTDGVLPTLAGRSDLSPEQYQRIADREKAPAAVLAQNEAVPRSVVASLPARGIAALARHLRDEFGDDPDAWEVAFGLWDTTETLTCEGLSSAVKTLIGKQ